MKNRFFNQGLLSESYGFVGMRQALSLKEIDYRVYKMFKFIKHHSSLNSLYCRICALHVIRLSENASTALPATSVTDGSIAYVIQVISIFIY